MRRYLAPVRAFVGLWIVLKICDRMADTVLCMLAIMGGLRWMAAKVNEMNVVEARRDFLVGGQLSFTNVLQTL